jgi:hypothetical protein
LRVRTLLSGVGILALSAASQVQAQGERLTDRAKQDREIVYSLEAPATNAFSLYHDYTESKEGADRYVNVVRKGSTVSHPSAISLDTGEPLTTETLKGAEIARAKLEIGEEVRPDSEAVLVRFPRCQEGTLVADPDLGNLHGPEELPPRRRGPRL